MSRNRCQGTPGRSDRPGVGGASAAAYRHRRSLGPAIRCLPRPAWQEAGDDVDVDVDVVGGTMVYGPGGWVLWVEPDRLWVRLPGEWVMGYGGCLAGDLLLRRRYPAAMPMLLLYAAVKQRVKLLVVVVSCCCWLLK